MGVDQKTRPKYTLSTLKKKRPHLDTSFILTYPPGRPGSTLVSAHFKVSHWPQSRTYTLAPGPLAASPAGFKRGGSSLAHPSPPSPAPQASAPAPLPVSAPSEAVHPYLTERKTSGSHTQSAAVSSHSSKPQGFSKFSSLS